MQFISVKYIARSSNSLHKCLTACAVLCLLFGASAGAADRDAWRHPDSRFAAVDDAVDDDDFPQAQKLLAEIRAEANGPLKLVDGKISGSIGSMWIADKDVAGWATISFSEFPPVK